MWYRRHLDRVVLIGVTILCATGCPNYFAQRNQLASGTIYGRIWVVNPETGRERALDRGCRIEVVTAHQRAQVTSQEGASYRILVPEIGRWPLTLYYKGHELTTEIGAYGAPTEVNLFVDQKDGELFLRAVWVDPDPQRRR
jgi:hypothetical protein